MPNFVEFYIYCWTCRGSGQKQQGGEETVTCPACGGNGKILYGYLNIDDLPTLPTNVFLSHVVWEATKISEYQALSEVQQESYNKIIHAGTVDLNAGSNSRAVLWNLFSSESDTRTALQALLV